MKRASGFALAGLMFAFSSAAFAVGGLPWPAAAMAGTAFLYIMLAYRARSQMQAPPPSKD